MVVYIYNVNFFFFLMCSFSLVLIPGIFTRAGRHRVLKWARFVFCRFFVFAFLVLPILHFGR